MIQRDERTESFPFTRIDISSSPIEATKKKKEGVEDEIQEFSSV